MGLANSEHAICFSRWISLIRLRSHCLLIVHCEEMRNNWRTHYFDWQKDKIRQNVLTSACSFNKLLAVVLCRHSGSVGMAAAPLKFFPTWEVGSALLLLAEVTDTQLCFFSVPQFDTCLMVFCDGIWGEGFLPKTHWQIRVVKQSLNSRTLDSDLRHPWGTICDNIRTVQAAQQRVRACSLCSFPEEQK